MAIRVRHYLFAVKGIIKRFPLETLCVLFATTTDLLYVNFKANPNFDKELYDDFLRISNLAFLLFLSFSLFRSSLRLSKPWQISSWVIPSILVASFWFYIHIPEAPKLAELRFLFLSGTLHLAVSFSAFMTADQRNFWTFNKALFLRILASALYSSVLFGGLSLALLALNYLFGWKIETESYLTLLGLTFILFSPLYFLGGIPPVGELTPEPAVEQYPKTLRYFTQYVLIPLVSVYLLILISYEVKILLQWVLPKGWVSLMILCYGLGATLALLLVFPLREDSRYVWIKTYSTFFFWTLLPLTVLLFLSIFRRLHDYGFTESRFLVAALAFWLAAISIYYIVRKNAGIHVIPKSLFMCGFICLFSPWNAFNVSKESQLQRFKAFIVEIGGHPSNKSHSKNYDRYVQLGQVYDFLYTRYSYHPFQKFVNFDLKKIYDSFKTDDTRYAPLLGAYDGRSFARTTKMQDTIYNSLNLKKALYNGEYTNIKTYYYINQSTSIRVTGYDFILRGNTLSETAVKDSIWIQGSKIPISMALNGSEFNVILAKDSLHFNLSQVLKLYKAQPPNLNNGLIEHENEHFMKFPAQEKTWTGLLALTEIRFNPSLNELAPESYNWNLLLKLNDTTFKQPAHLHNKHPQGQDLH